MPWSTLGRGSYPRHFSIWSIMADLSIFIDESGDFGSYERYCPFYIITMVFHDQSNPIDYEISELRRHVEEQGFPPNHAIHTAPLVRREEDYRHLDWEPRRKLFRHIFEFVRFCNISYKTFVFKRKEYPSADKLISQMSKEISAFVRENLAWLTSYRRVVVYYDNGQKEVSRLINAVLNTMLDAEVKEAHPEKYCLLQAADLICTLELIRTKEMEKNYDLSKSEKTFFPNRRILIKNYLKPLEKMQVEKKRTSKNQ